MATKHKVSYNQRNYYFNGFKGAHFLSSTEAHSFEHSYSSKSFNGMSCGVKFMTNPVKTRSFLKIMPPKKAKDEANNDSFKTPPEKPVLQFEIEARSSANSNIANQG